MLKSAGNARFVLPSLSLSLSLSPYLVTEQVFFPYLVIVTKPIEFRILDVLATMKRCWRHLNRAMQHTIDCNQIGIIPSKSMDTNRYLTFRTRPLSSSICSAALRIGIRLHKSNAFQRKAEKRILSLCCASQKHPKALLVVVKGAAVGNIWVALSSTDAPKSASLCQTSRPPSPRTLLVVVAFQFVLFVRLLFLSFVFLSFVFLVCGPIHVL
jgi:hypothetical protein